MKKLLLIFLCLPMIFNSCSKEGADIVVEPTTLHNVWSLHMQTTLFEDGYLGGNRIINNILFYNSIQESILLSSGILDSIITGQSTIYNSRIWSISENQNIIETYFDENDFPYNVLQHNYVRYADTLEINFQSGNIQKFLINYLQNDELHITSVVNDTVFLPVFDVNGIYQDTVLYSIYSNKYFFNKQ